MNLCQSTVQSKFDATVEDAFRFVVPISLPSIFTGYGLLPAVVGTKEQTGNWDAAEQSRLVVLSDGSTARERLNTYECPHEFSYTVDEFTGTLRYLVQSAQGVWRFMEHDRQTHVIWTYRFHPKTFFVTPIVWFIAQVLWRGYMKKAVRLTREQMQERSRISE